MRYLKRGFAVLLAAGLVFPAAFAHRTRTTSSHNRIYSPSYTRMEQLNAIIDRNSVKTQVRPFNWMNRVTIGGLVNIDAIFAQRGWNVSGPATAGVIPNFRINRSGSERIETDRASDISVTNANLLVDAKPNNWFKVHLGAVYRDLLGPQESYAGVDELYATLANFARSPFYVRAGRVYVPIGSHDETYPLTVGFTQLITQTNATVLQLGYISRSRGLYGTVYAFNSPFSSEILLNNDVAQSYGSTSGLTDNLARASRIRNFGGKLGYRSKYRGYMYDVEASYMKDFRDTSFFLANERDPQRPQDVAQARNGKFRRAAVYALHGYVRRGACDFLVDYVSLTRGLDVSSNANDTRLNTRLWAYGVRGGYWFKSFNYRSKFQLGYERSGHAVFSTWQEGHSSRLDPARYLPRFRYIADYIVNVGRSTSFTLQYAYAKDYDRPNDSIAGLAVDLNRQSESTIKARLSVAF